MKNFKGTKTEWCSVEFAGFIILKDSDFYEGKNILDYSDVGEVVANANAKLAKHSYELLEALETIKEHLQDTLNEYGSESLEKRTSIVLVNELINKVTS